MTKQRPHKRRSKLGTTFKAGRGSCRSKNNMPWQMTRGEWDNNGQPTLGIENMKIYSKPPWNVSPISEKKAYKDFKKNVGTSKGGDIAPYDYSPKHYPYINRDKSYNRKYDRSGGGHKFLSSLKPSKKLRSLGASGGQEDVREAIIFGRKMGFLDTDILYYIERNYSL